MNTTTSGSEDVPNKGDSKHVRPWKDLESWEQYGIQQRYQTRTPSSFARSEKPEERAWYRKGQNEGWTGEFEFKRKLEKLPWKSQEAWNQFGEEHHYHTRSQNSLAKSEQPEERAWYYKGLREEWTKDFEFRPGNIGVPYQTEEAWTQHGIQHAFHGGTQSNLARSEKPEERSWYLKGQREGWLRTFSFGALPKDQKPAENPQDHRDEGLEQRV